MGPLSDIRVVELGQLIAGPFCAQLFGDLGATVVKIEPPKTGDPMRQWGAGDPPVWWEVIARNKRSVAADLRTPDGQEIARRLIAGADVLVENFRPGTLEKWHLDPADLCAANPRLIVVRVSGYGQTGPYARRAGFGGIGEAMGGWRALVGTPDRPPSRLGVSIGDSLAGTYGCLGALAALHEREKSGRGQIVDVSLFESVLQVMEGLIPEYVAAGHVRARSGSILKGIAPSNVYPCSDGELLIAANQDAIFRRLAAAMGTPELADDARFATHNARGRHQELLDTLIADWTRGQSVAAVEALMEQHAVPAGRMFGARDMLADPHFAAREAIVSVETARHGDLPMQGVFPRLTRTPGGIRRPAPAEVGADTEAELRDAGYDEATIADLKRRGIV
ncbi:MULTISPECIES: CoA transferase [unclassified Sphingomonas]|uniref:CaiB/BaiF CoA transferase family protein n=1 Tax=unclassified Sphingomonas TaxID=196159 RepID=UPI00092C3588|nr:MULTISPECIES: CoA transferase [unclassified Sphingomonas]OJU23505.1 MAG: formyl-CoA transferase [Sphingomonas sp. 66-10]